MSGPLGSQQWMYASGAEAQQQSLKFNDDESQYLSWTPAAAGNRKTWTWSGWVKRGKISGSGWSVLFGASASLTNNDQLLLRMTNGEGQLFWRQEVSGIARTSLNSIALFRDPSAWYHIVTAYDSTNATQADRIKIYVNGVRIELDNANPIELDRGTQINNAVAHHIGYAPQVSDYFDGYMSDIHFIDGQALDATSFGETVDGYWKAIDYAGTYGTNGFHLTFEDDVVSEGFNAVTYRGTGSTQSISGLGFQNDLLWIKSRSDPAGTHRLIDSVRGGSLALQSDNEGVEIDNSAQVPSPRDADGFTVAGNTSAFNQSGDKYVAWCWDAGSGSPVSNENGSITSTVKANPDYGFSIVSWVGDGTSQGATVGHSLGTVPSMIIVKSTDSDAGWNVWHKDLTNATTSRVLLNDTGDEFDSVYVWGSTAPDNSAFGVGVFGTATWTNRLNRNYIAYCFSDVVGYSSTGSYTGTGAAGNTITTGFPVAFVMTKRTDADGGWNIIDNTRDANTDLRLQPNTDSAEAALNTTFTNTGFILDTNASSINALNGKYIYIAFADTREAAFWKDVSGQGNHWTPNNLDYRDSVIDSPANNFATWNPIAVYYSGGTNYPPTTMSEGNLKATSNASGFIGTSTMFVNTNTGGKWYCEILANDMSGGDWVGISGVLNLGGYTIYSPNGTVNNSGTTSSQSTYTDGDVIGLSYDMTASTLEFFKNGVSQGSYSISYADGKDVPIQCAVGNVTGNNAIANFGQDSTFSGARPAGGNTDANGIGDFAYAPPSGYLALCTANLPEPTIVDGSEYFNTVLYTGTGVSNSITGVGFQPEFVWTNRRDNGASHNLHDIVRGAGQQLSTDETAEEVTNTNFASFDSDGFTVVSGNAYNGSGMTYAVWNWKAGGAASTIAVDTYSAGVPSIASQVSANVDAGFSIVSWTGTGSVEQVGHGLSSAPEMVIVKNRTSDVYDWVVGNDYAGTWNGVMFLNKTDAWDANNNQFNSTAPTSSVFTVGIAAATNGLSNDMIAYCFTNTDTTKLGSYTGNGSTDGPFVYTGFRPAWVMVKRAVGGTSNWDIMDSVRNTYNIVDKRLYANLNSGEPAATDYVDFTSNGFKVRNTASSQNVSGSTYIYLAFAETPFKYANAR